MWIFPEEFEVIVIGAGHAGCEAAHAAARMGCRTLLLSMNLDTIGKMSCNPAVGGTAKGHIVREIDALGGIMGKVAEETALHYRMLNLSKGPAVWSPRAQVDRFAYQMAMKRRLEHTPNLFIKQGTIEALQVVQGKVKGVETLEGITYLGENVVVSAGTFMRGLIHIGETTFTGGRLGDKSSTGLSNCLEKLGFKLGRLKTGTPPRIHRRSVDFSQMEIQYGEEGVRFSFDPPEGSPLPSAPCYITHTTPETKKIVLDHLHLSPMYSGKIQSVGPRYCPSIEDKFVRFDKERHQIFIEPEGLQTEELYVNGLSTSFPFDVQLKILHTVQGLEKVEVVRPAYAIVYDYVISGYLSSTLETKLVEGLFFAGQINGTTGYEEAGGQGIVAGINAACKVLKKEPLQLKRSEAYIGVMIDELITKELTEPYRMFTSRAEFRLLLRQDNADLRLREYGYQLGLIERDRYEHLLHKKRICEEKIELINRTFVSFEGKSLTLAQLLRRPEITYLNLVDLYPALLQNHGEEINLHIQFQIKYAGYIERQEQEIIKLQSLDIFLPKEFDFQATSGLSREAQERLSHIRPASLAQASRLSGITSSDLTVLRVALKNRA